MKRLTLVISSSILHTQNVSKDFPDILKPAGRFSELGGFLAVP